MANALTQYLEKPNVSMKLGELLGKKAAAFKTALLNIYTGNVQLQKCDVRSIAGAAVLTATMDLSLTPSLGQAYIVPMRGQATFQIGARGLTQLAHRTGQYTRLYAGKVFEGEIRGRDPITGDLIRGEKISDEVIGYVAYMRLVNGYEQSEFMTVDEIEKHAEKYSQSYSYDKRNGKQSSPWSTNFDAMASKTVLKKLLRTWGILSTDMAIAIQADQSVVDKNTFTYIDNGGNVQRRDTIYAQETETVDDLPFDSETGEVQSDTPQEETES